MARDPVCGMEVEDSKAPARAVYRGKTYYFCSGHCKAEFDRHPTRYVDGDDAAEGPPPYHP